MKHHHLTRALALISLLAAAPAALAQTPALVPYQGRVQTGTPAADFTGQGLFKFALVAGTANVSVQATATVTRFANNTLNVFTVTNQGAGYVSVPAVTITGGGGSGATATAVLTGDKVTSITLNNPGSGYTTVPTVTIAAPPPRQQQLWVNNGALTADPAAAVSVNVTNGLYSVMLGDTSLGNMLAIPPSVFANADVRLRVWFNGTQLSPDQRLAPNGYLPSNISVGGTVGIGTDTPRGKLDVFGEVYSSGTGAGFSFDIRNNPVPPALRQRYVWSADNDGAKLWHSAKGDRLVITQDGNVGIGTLSPTQAKLVVLGGPLNNPEGAGTKYNYLDDVDSNTVHHSPGGAQEETSIYADKAIWSGTYIICSSDERIKTIRGQSDSATDLQTVRALQITDYNYKDTVANSGRMQKKLIAQQVEKVYPQAVNRNTNVVPDIYRKAAFHDGWVALKTDLKQGERVRLLDDKNGEGIHEVLEVKDGAFRTGFKPAGDKVFVYGREVNDFRTVDYDAISMLNVSATQELARQLDAKSAEVLALQKENAALKAALAENASKDRAQDEKLAALAKLLEDRAPSAAVTTVSTVTTQP